MADSRTPEDKAKQASDMMGVDVPASTFEHLTALHAAISRVADMNRLMRDENVLEDLRFAILVTCGQAMKELCAAASVYAKDMAELEEKGQAKALAEQAATAGMANC